MRALHVGQHLMSQRFRAFGIVGVLLAAWYLPLFTFAAFSPFCSINFESESICYLGNTNYGPLYGRVMIDSLAALVLIVIGLAVIAAVIARKSKADAA